MTFILLCIWPQGSVTSGDERKKISNSQNEIKGDSDSIYCLKIMMLFG